MAECMPWKAVEHEILDALDIAAEYRALGVVFTQDTPRQNGWQPCHAAGRQDNKASAAVCIQGAARGRYRDLGGSDGQSLSLWEFAARYGGHGDWREARKHYALRLGIKLPAGTEPRRPDDQIEFLTTPVAPDILASWCQDKGGFGLQTVLDNGGRYARYPKKARPEHAQYVVAFPAYNPPGLTDSDPAAWVITNSTSAPLQVYKGKGQAPGQAKTLSVGGSVGGLLGSYGLNHLETAEYVWKVEGLSDLLTLHDRLRGCGLLGQHVVISNSQGTLETVKPEWQMLLRGLPNLKALYVIHDCDRPGQIGAERWCQLLAPHLRVKSVVLPYEIKENHGEDVRDYLQRDRHAIEELIALAEKTEVWRPAPPRLAMATAPAAVAPGLFADGGVATAVPAPVEPPRYDVEGGRICFCTWANDGTVERLPLCNFTASVVEEVVRDDGAETTTYFAIDGQLQDRRQLPRIEVKAGAYADLEWITAQWGIHPIISVGRSVREHLRAGIQHLSAGAPRRHVYTHTGWRQIDGRWHYLHGNGAIGADGMACGVTVSLDQALADFRLPAPPEGSALVDDVRASLGMLNGLADDAIVFPIYAAIWRAAIGATDMSVHLAGRTGTFKSEIASLAQRHFGQAMHAKNLPANWSSTANALEDQSFIVKDALMVVDDFCPVGSAADVARYHRDADRYFRAVGNNTDRRRMNADGSLRTPRPPRCLPLSTGEDVPRGESLRARLLIVEMAQGDVKVEALTACQKAAEAGRYAGAMAGFLRWLAPRYDQVRQRLPVKVEEYRARAAQDNEHRRTPTTVAQLAAGLEVFLDFARAINALSQDEAENLFERYWAALHETAAGQASQHRAEEPTAQFLRLLAACITSGRAHVASPTGQEPTYGDGGADMVPSNGPAGWGWRLDGFHAWTAQGRLVGWLEGDNLYLDPDASFAEAQRLANEQGQGMPLTAQTLRKRLYERGLLVTTEMAGRRELTVRRVLQEKRRTVLHLRADALEGEGAAAQRPVQADAFGALDAGTAGAMLAPLVSAKVAQPVASEAVANLLAIILD